MDTAGVYDCVVLRHAVVYVFVVLAPTSVSLLQAAEAGASLFPIQEKRG
jgi:hypothetical protein